MNTGSLRARLLNRPFWSLKYADGTTISEWDQDWANIPVDGRRELRLYCPNGKTGELVTTHERRLFQFKQGELRAGVGRRTICQVIGMIDGEQGACRCYAWEYERGQLTKFRDNVYDFKYGNVGALNLKVLGASEWLI